MNLDEQFNEFLKGDNVVKTDNDNYLTQCTQYRKKFTLKDLKKYFIKEYYSTSL